MVLFNQEALDKRARNLGNLNGFKLVLVTLQPALNPVEARLEVHFHNSNELANIVNDFNANAALAREIFPISGGHRLPAGAATGQVRVTSIAVGPANHILFLAIAPIGDYSTYTLGISYQNIDPIFSELHFKFRPGCFSTNCAPEWSKGQAPKAVPAIDYLAKDYDSFRHTLIAAMMQRVPGWQPTSEADLDQTLLELFSTAADELSDYQDRVMNEAYLGTARKRVSLARHARLMDYHIHQGNQASTWIALRLAPGSDGSLPPGFTVWTGSDTLSATSRIFVSRSPALVDSLLNQMQLYTWSDSIPSLAAGGTTADLAFASKVDADKVRDLIRTGRTVDVFRNGQRVGEQTVRITHLLLQEWLNPATGQEAGRDANKRQILELLPGNAGAETLQDPLTGAWLVRVRWAEKDKLKHNYCFTIDCPSPVGKIENVSRFHGNLLQVYHGSPRAVDFLEPDTLLTERWGTICRLPDGPLAYQSTSPGGEVPPQSTLEVTVELDGTIDPWDERISLIHSDDDSSENGDHYMVETDEEGRSLLRFGNGINGRKLPSGAIVHCRYQIGDGLDGNVGADTLVNFDSRNIAFNDLPPAEQIAFQTLVTGGKVWNPLDATNGRAPEPVSEIIRRVPEAFRYRQLRAVTLQDYVRRAEELPGVSRAAARYAWTGSWRTVQITIDPAGTTTLDEHLRRQVADYLETVRLIGEDLEIRPPRFVPLEIHVALCLHPDYWPEDLKFILEQEFSDGYTPDGRQGFFHPDLWTFGQELHASQIIGRAQAIEGVEHIISVTLKRWGEAGAGTEAIMALRPNEIIRVHNDPDHMEKGFIDFDVRGGRQ